VAERLVDLSPRLRRLREADGESGDETLPPAPLGAPPALAVRSRDFR
jgi:hypothetical protein